MTTKQKTTANFILLFIIITISTAFFKNSYCATLTITLDTSKKIYGIGDKADLWGNVTLDGGIVNDALVAVEVDNPNGTAVILRTRTTGNPPPTSVIQILNVTPSDQNGSAKNSFKRGTLAYFEISINNTGTSSKYAEITLNIFDSRNVAFEALVVYQGPLFNGTTEIFVPEPIPTDIAQGTATAYVNAYTSLPSRGGFAYSPEKSAIFAVSDTDAPPIPNPEQTTLGLYNVTFMIDNYATTRLFRPGNYTATAACKYQTETTSISKTFEVVLTGDINRDGVVNILDAILLSNAFLSTPASPNWNPRADLDFSGKVNILDAIIIANNFLKRA